MTHKEFDTIIEKRIDSIRSILAKKRNEYATKNNRFHNFYAAAAMDDTTPEKALWGMRLKHEVSCRDLVYGGTKEITEKLIEEKIGDNINYLILLEGLLKEKLIEEEL